MKKVISGILISLTVLTLVACSNNTTPSSSVTEPSSSKIVEPEPSEASSTSPQSSSAIAATEPPTDASSASSSEKEESSSTQSEVPQQAKTVISITPIVAQGEGTAFSVSDRATQNSILSYLANIQSIEPAHAPIMGGSFFLISVNLNGVTTEYQLSNHNDTPNGDYRLSQDSQSYSVDPALWDVISTIAPHTPSAPSDPSESIGDTVISVTPIGVQGEGETFTIPSDAQTVILTYLANLQEVDPVRDPIMGGSFFHITVNEKGTVTEYELSNHNNTPNGFFRISKDSLPYSVDRALWDAITEFYPEFAINN